MSSSVRRLSFELLIAFLGVLGPSAYPAVAADPRAEASRLTFLLVPESRWQAEDKSAEALPAGTLRFYREGDTEPSFTAEANREQEVPPGKWVWIAEAPGYVSVATGAAVVSADEPMKKTVVWPVVPACRARLVADAGWRGATRLDLVSVTRSAVYPVKPVAGKELWVPAGQLLAYSVGNRGLIGIRRLGSCVQNQRVDVAAPVPPPASRQDFLVHAVVPKAAARSTALAAHLRSSTARTEVNPHAVVWSRERASFFFLGVPADGRREVVIGHPKLRTSVTEVAPLGGSARELPQVALHERLTLALQIDYRPKRPHRIEELEIFHCGRGPVAPTDYARCRKLPQRPRLRADVDEYLLKDLDDGKYVIQARIDDELIVGLGAGVFPYLEPGAAEAPKPSRVRLWEMRIFGHLLADGEPVPGEVRLLPAVQGHPVRRFPTDEDLTYSLYYFGRRPPTRPQDADWSDAKLLGLYIAQYRLAACGQDGGCRLFGVHSNLRGEGRLDLELGADRELQVEVVDEKDGSAIPGAIVAVPRPPRDLVFDWGRVSWSKAGGIEAVGLPTGPRGFVRVRDIAEGRQWFVVEADGYERFEKDVTIPARGVATHRAELRRSDERTGVTVRLAGGAPLANAYLLVVDGRGQRVLHCSRSTNAQGVASFDEDCLDGRQVVVLHPLASVTSLRGGALRTRSEVTVPRVGHRPIRVRLTNEDGEVLARTRVGLQYRSFVLGEDDLLAAMTYTGQQPFLTTDDAGEVRLRGVDLEAVEVPHLIVGTERFSLGGYEPGETIELRVGSD